MVTHRYSGFPVNRFFDPDLWLRTFRDPLARASLLVDALPLAGVVFFGWGATPLVALYWLENIVLGIMAVGRMLITSMQSAKWFNALFFIPFFCVHYGMFTFAHGLFLKLMSRGTDLEKIDETAAVSGEHFGTLIEWAMSSGDAISFFAFAIIALNLAFLMVDFIGKREFETASMGRLMATPYGRIMILHVAIIFGALFVYGANEPLAGVLFLLLLRFVFGIGLSVWRRLRLDAPKT